MDQDEKVGDRCLVEPLAGCDGLSRGHFQAISLRTEPTCFEAYSKSLRPAQWLKSICGEERSGGTFYLVDWVGWSLPEATWEPLANLLEFLKRVALPFPQM